MLVVGVPPYLEKGKGEFVKAQVCPTLLPDIIFVKVLEMHFGSNIKILARKELALKVG